MTDKQVIAVIGCGSIGSRYAQWLKELGNRVLIFDQNKDAVQALAKKLEVESFPDLNSLFSQRPVKALIATPPLYHAEAAIKALQLNIDILVEKPLAASEPDAKTICEAALKSSAKAWGVCNMRFHDGPAEVQKKLSRIGRPIFARLHVGHRLSQMRPAGLSVYAGKTAEGGGIILDCIHEVDYMQWLLGGVKRLRSWRKQIGEDDIGGDDFAEVQFELNSGLCATIHFDFVSRHKRRGIEVVGTEGTIWWASEGKAPENCVVNFANQNTLDCLYSNNNVSPEASYKRMLESFLSNGSGLQTIQESYATLKLALIASDSQW